MTIEIFLKDREFYMNVYAIVWFRVSERRKLNIYRKKDALALPTKVQRSAKETNSTQHAVTTLRRKS